MATDAVIQLDQVGRVFGSGDQAVHALQGINLHIPAGQFVVLMGPSGSGKTTLLNLVGGLDQPSSGVVTVAGQRLDQLSAAELASMRRRMGFIFQSFALTPTASAYENIELALRIAGDIPRNEWERRIRRALALVGLAERGHHRPYELSGGQQQRVAIARALVTRPKILLADEPTGDLDTRTGERILTVLREICSRAQATLLMATHDPAAAAFAHQVYHLRDGQIVGEAHKSEQKP
ncbi:MAG: ABC transporter ATP-binding protein [Roseiflexaceae bacterium]